MRISRTMNAPNGDTITVDIKLTAEELSAAHEEYVTNFMKSEFENTFGYSDEISEELAKSAYEEYAKGEGLTEYECIEKIADEYEKR